MSGAKKWQAPLARLPATVPGFFGGGPGQKPIHCITTFEAVNRKGTDLRVSGTIATVGHFAATELTSIVSPFKVPVTVTF
jgi:hypothetical protein